MVSDNLANFIIKLKNANFAKKESVVFPYSKLINAITETLKQEGFVEEIGKKGKKTVKFVEIKLRYKEGKPAISGVKRVSKLSRRVYLPAKDIRPVKSNFGRLILSTSKGILTDRDARKNRVGGEVLFEIW